MKATGPRVDFLKYIFADSPAAVGCLELGELVEQGSLAVFFRIAGESEQRGRAQKLVEKLSDRGPNADYPESLVI